MKRIEMFIGTEKDKDNATLPASVRYYAIEHGRRILTNAFGGYTELLTVGGWKGNDGRVVTEAGLKYEIWVETWPGSALVEGTARTLRDLWHQAAVLLSVSGEGSFI